MIKCLVIGDPHFIETNVEIIESFIKRIENLVKKHNPNFVVILGDLLHSFEKIHTLAFNLALKFIKTIAKLVPIYLIIGNHDLINNSQFLSENHGFNSLKDIYNITICDKVVTEIFLVGKREMKFLFCPYVPPGRFEEALATGGKYKDAVCIFAHQEFYGSRYNPLYPSVNGDKWPTSFPLVVSGHIHIEGFLGTNIYYPGNSIQENYNDAGEKTVALIEFSFGKPGYKIEKIKLNLKKKIIYELEMEKIDDFKAGNNEEGILKIKCTTQEKKLFKKSDLYKKLSLNYQILLDDRSVISDPLLVKFKEIKETNVLKILERLVKDDKNIFLSQAFEKFKDRI